MALLLGHGAALSRQGLVDAIWGERPPRSAVQALQVYIHGLRQALGTDRVATVGTGYRLHVEPGELDLDRFDAFVERARNALDQGGAADAADDVEAGLSLWRGEPFADIEGEPIAAAEGPRLRERRLSGLELRADALLALGRHEELVAELEGLIATEPYRERLREQHILALYRAGRQKEALEAYRTARAALVDELGVEPGASLQELERRILQQDPELAAKARPNLFHEIGAAVDPDQAATQVKVMDFATETLGRERAEELRDAGSALSIDAFATLSR